MSEPDDELRQQIMRAVAGNSFAQCADRVLEIIARREKAARIKALEELAAEMYEPEDGGHPVWRKIEKERQL